MKNRKTIVIAIFGKSGSGKDTVKKFLLKSIENSQNIISNTTRPARDYEENGIDYYFLPVADFIKKITKKEMLEASLFNNWLYGTSIDSLDKNKINIGVFEPKGIRALLKKEELLVIPIYLDVTNKERLMRQLNREENPDCAEICRRFFTDEEDFLLEDLDFNFYKFSNEKESDLKNTVIPMICNILNNSIKNS